MIDSSLAATLVRGKYWKPASVRRVRRWWRPDGGDSGGYCGRASYSRKGVSQQGHN